MNFGDRLKKYRKMHKMKQSELANLIGISRSYLSELESGKKTPGPEVEKKILKILNSGTNLQPKNVTDLSSDGDIKSLYKKRIISDMQNLGTFKNEFEQLIDIYADLLVQYRNALNKYQNEKETHDYYMLDTGKKPPIILILENLRKDIITYSDRLALNPKSIQGIEFNDKPKSKLAEALSNFG